MATIQWTNERGKMSLKHIENGNKTLCGISIPYRRKEWSFYGETECGKCKQIKRKTTNPDE
ncbi:hypothetical protein [uncultured Shewanella sp.]|uniref:hypothetical protein n=1 Tax=uncultured Shewanella sp. TaxID=173975 RepID=UPI002626949B|nr:hypothetical protein [uncultured Shewanella sp.]